ncbi:helix-turn-helix domain-containing protein [Ruminococcus flavefaciens]|uniref:Helix-turn-helix n=1 Tax=Ruminococcus flavefaciens TaxID=1265 RepID=A0A1K1MYU7_RUMFL|nr:helix-turn-helix domain-containing protein [Ruminococcus flavefaciens]SFW28287.1 Helix-turn-helix [Ruminococcus flavefaciens]
MDQIKTGALIRQLRLDSGMTQKQLAEAICVSDKAVSKWECGNGCPDVSLLAELSAVFGTDVQTLLSGGINKNESEKGNMKKLKFYVCKECGNIITATSEAAVTCCGNKLTALEPVKAEGADMLRTEDLGGEWFISSDHEMKKEHYISFAAYVTDSSAMIFKQYPEWNLQITLPYYRSGRLVWYCTKHGFFYQDIRRDSGTGK